MKIFTIQENDAGSRLDKFLKKLLPRATRGLIYKCNRKGKIKIKSCGEDGFKKRDNEYKLSVFDEIKIFLSDKDFELLQEEKVKPCIKTDEKFNIRDRVYEDNDILIVNKNPFLNVHPGDYKTKEVDLITQVRDYLGEKLNSLTFKPSLVHRIDRDTSGIVMIAKKKDILQKLAKDFKTHQKIQKIYYAIVVGKVSRKEGIIKKSIHRIENAKNENKVCISDAGKYAETHYKVLGEYTLQTSKEQLVISELEVQIKTGRMHQIRLHMSAMGTPIVGDSTYGNLKLNKFFENNFGLKRQALHAWKIGFFHYGRDKKMMLEAHIKDDLQQFMREIKKH